MTTSTDLVSVRFDYTGNPNYPKNAQRTITFTDPTGTTCTKTMSIGVIKNPNYISVKELESSRMFLTLKKGDTLSIRIYKPEEDSPTTFDTRNSPPETPPLEDADVKIPITKDARILALFFDAQTSEFHYSFFNKTHKANLYMSKKALQYASTISPNWIRERSIGSSSSSTSLNES